jgi:amidase
MRLVSYLVLLFAAMLIACEKKEKPATTVRPADAQYLEEITIATLQAGYAKKEYSIADVVRDYLDRIEAIDRKGAHLNSIICINPDALAIADALDKELAAGKSRGPLHGIPVILKDNIDTHDKMPNTGGARVLRNSFPEKDSWVAQKLREAGAVILGKANLSEWANFRASMSSSGWSGVGGQTKNPYILDRNPCGSSSGSGASVSANLCMIAIGTETNGSIVCPANNNGVVGLKPTVGLISRSGIIPISFSQDTPGPMGRTVTDVAISLGALVGVDSSDTKTLASAGNFKTDYTPYLKADGLKGKRIGLLTGSLGYHPRVDTLMRQAVAYLKGQGAEVIEINEPVGRGANDPSFQVLLYEFKDGLQKYFQSLGVHAPVKNLKELMAFNEKDSVELRYFDQQLLQLAERKGDLNTPEYKKALEDMHRLTQKEGIDKFVAQYKLDAFMAPTGSPAWKTDLTNGDHFMGGSSSLAAIAGYPSIALPLGFIEGLPVDVSFFGKAWSEPLLLEIAYSYEQGTKHRKAPRFLPTN